MRMMSARLQRTPAETKMPTRGADALALKRHRENSMIGRTACARSVLFCSALQEVFSRPTDYVVERGRGPPGVPQAGGREKKSGPERRGLPRQLPGIVTPSIAASS